MKKITALILAAGTGQRMHTDIPKQFIKINGKPLFIYSVERFLQVADVVIVVTAKEQLPTCEDLLREAGLSERVRVTEGGGERFESSYKGLLAAKKEGAELVLIHDAARANISEDVIRRVLSETETHGAAVAAVPMKDTVKRADGDGFVKETLQREELWSIQTPQGFLTDLILSAYEKMGVSNMKALGVTDDSMVMEKALQRPVKLVMGDYDNIKVTTPSDLLIIQEKMETKC